MNILHAIPLTPCHFSNVPASLQYFCCKMSYNVAFHYFADSFSCLPSLIPSSLDRDEVNTVVIFLTPILHQLLSPGSFLRCLRLTTPLVSLDSSKDLENQPIKKNHFCYHKNINIYCHFLTSERYSLLGARKDYWNFISDSIPKDDGVKFVQAIPQVYKNCSNSISEINHSHRLATSKRQEIFSCILRMVALI